jgi:hypothetical protein
VSKFPLAVWLSDQSKGFRAGSATATPSAKLIPCFRHMDLALSFPSSPWSKKYLNNTSKTQRAFLRGRMSLLNRCGSKAMMQACLPIAINDFVKVGEGQFAAFYASEHGATDYRFNPSGVFGITSDTQPWENLFRIYQGQSNKTNPVVDCGRTLDEFLRYSVDSILEYHAGFREYRGLGMSGALATATRIPDRDTLMLLALMGPGDVLEESEHSFRVNGPTQIGNNHSPSRSNSRDAVYLWCKQAHLHLPNLSSAFWFGAS